MEVKIRVYGSGICRDTATGKKLIKFIDGYADIDLRDYSKRQIENIKRRFKFKDLENGILNVANEKKEDVIVAEQAPAEIEKSAVNTDEVYGSNRKKLVEIAKTLGIEGKLMTFETEVLRNKILNKLKEKTHA